MTDKITLPRSGFVLTQAPDVDHPWFEGRAGQLKFRIRRIFTDGTKWRSEILFESGREVLATSSEHVGLTPEASRDLAVQRTDERVISLRAALLPADARDRVAGVLLVEWARGAQFTLNTTPSQSAIDAATRMADAVLAALGGKP